ncbi:hypothetical protein CRG98_017787 [Punica granatum]|uniref:Uncharacterized protein n=1 Tax=Punica granatum TaxID=22663 RepID=A0A2I0K129_PUNGR|nr:hypothetical protein CRG98_017787 [Punica granatum]
MWRTPLDIGGSGPPIGDPDPSIEDTGTNEERWRARWRGRGHRLVAPTPKGRFRSIHRGPGTQEDAGDLVEGLGSLIDGPNPESIGDSRRSPVDARLGPPINDPDPSIEVASVFCRYWQPRWRGRGHQLAASTPNRPGTPDFEYPVDSGLGLSNPPPRSPESSVGTGDLGGGQSATSTLHSLSDFFVGLK